MSANQASTIDHLALTSALLKLGGDPGAIPRFEERQPAPQAPPFQPLSDWEWARIEPHIRTVVQRMRPPNAARAFMNNLLIGQHSGLSTRYLSNDQESTRQRALRWSLDGRLEKLAADLRAAGELSEVRLVTFEAVSEKARATCVRIFGGRAVRLTARIGERTES
jgi:transposase